MRRLPKTLSMFRGTPLAEEIHKNLTRLTSDERARLIYGLYDTAQPLPHCGVLLAGRNIVAWILTTGREDSSADKVGDVMNEDMESLLAAPEHEKLHWRLMGSAYTHLPLLCKKVGVLHEREAFSGGFRETFTRTTVTWNRHVCSDITDCLGMVEIIPADLLTKKRLANPDDYEVDVLVPCEKSWAWEAVARGTARSRAQWELKTPAFWTLPKRRRDVTHEGIVFHAETFNDALVDHQKPELPPSFLVGLTEVKVSHRHPTKGDVELRAWRHNSDRCWTLDLKMDGNRGGHRSYKIIDGALAMQLTELAAMSAALPAADAATDNLDASASAFQALLEQVHERQRELQFVCDALGVQPPPHPAQEPAA